MVLMFHLINPFGLGNAVMSCLVLVVMSNVFDENDCLLSVKCFLLGP